MGQDAPGQVLAGYFRARPVPALGVAVSGGGDSIALLRLVVDWAEGHVPLAAVTVDHGLRPEATEEARFVAQVCAGLGVPHAVLNWRGWDGRGNLQDQARRARYDLIAEWAQARGLSDVALAHTLDDQAETFVMRLARASGVDGLAAMAERQVRGVRFHRPLIGCTRDALRGVLTDLGQGWIEDPSNNDPSYDRIRLRQQMPRLADLGMTAGALSQVALNMAQARDALNWACHRFAQEHLTMQGPDVRIEAAAFADLPEELQRRLLAHVLTWLSGAEYGPRRDPLQQMLEAARAGQRMVLHGCVLTHRQQRLYLHREYAGVAASRALPGALWDRRWILSGPAQPDQIVRPLGRAGLDQLPDWRALGRPAAAVMADPGVWLGDRLIAAPLSGNANGWRAEPPKGRLDCHSALLSH